MASSRNQLCRISPLEKPSPLSGPLPSLTIPCSPEVGYQVTGKMPRPSRSPGIPRSASVSLPPSPEAPSSTRYTFINWKSVFSHCMFPEKSFSFLPYTDTNKKQSSMKPNMCKMLVMLNKCVYAWYIPLISSNEVCSWYGKCSSVLHIRSLP